MIYKFPFPNLATQILVLEKPISTKRTYCVYYDYLPENFNQENAYERAAVT